MNELSFRSVNAITGLEECRKAAVKLIAFRVSECGAMVLKLVKMTCGGKGPALCKGSFSSPSYRVGLMKVTTDSVPAK